MRGDAGAVGGVSEIVLSKPSDWPRLVRERRACTACVCWLLDGGRMAAALAAGLGRDVPLTWTAGTRSAAHKPVAAAVVRRLLGEAVPFSAGAASAMEGGRREDGERTERGRRHGLTQRRRGEGGRRGGFIGDGRLQSTSVGRGEQARPRCLR
jgi:hypothetical protein